MALTSLRLGLRRLGGRSRLSLKSRGFNGNGLAYLLLDEFYDTLAAGSVNGTSAQPGPGTRTVTDTNSKLSIAGGVASFATGGAAAGNPGLWYPSQGSVVLGRTVLARIISNSGANDGAIFGWDRAQSGNLQDGFFFKASSVLRIVPDGLTSVVVGAFVDGTAYDCAVVQRAAGMFFFIKGGLFTTWNLIWAHTSSSLSIYPGIDASATTAVFTADNIRVPTALYVPTPLAYDTFTRANGALGNSEAVGPDAQAVTARAWTNYQGAWQVLGNLASCSSVGASGSAVAAYDTGASDVLHDVTCVSACNVGGVTRLSASDNFVSGWYDGTNAYLDKWVNGASTRVISAAAASAANAVIRQIVSGTSFSLYYNNAKVGATSTISDAGLQNNTKQGLYTNTTSGSADAVTTWPRGTGDEYVGLDSF